MHTTHLSFESPLPGVAVSTKPVNSLAKTLNTHINVLKMVTSLSLTSHRASAIPNLPPANERRVKQIKAECPIYACVCMYNIT